MRTADQINKIKYFQPFFKRGERPIKLIKKSLKDIISAVEKIHYRPVDDIPGAEWFTFQCGVLVFSVSFSKYYAPVELIKTLCLCQKYYYRKFAVGGENCMFNICMKRISHLRLL